MADLLKISIITPNYNYAHFIGQTIESVVNQDYENIEHVIVDDGSTDNSVEIIQSYQKRYPGKIKLIVQKNQGQSAAINVGLKAATGDIIGWINSDDMYAPNSFQTVVESLSSANVDAIYSNYYRVNSKGEVIANHIAQNSSKWMSLFYCFISSNTFFFKRKIIDNEVFIDNDFHICMDKEFFAHIYYADYKIVKVNTYFAYFRWHENNKSIDSSVVKEIRLNEGIEILRRYGKISHLKIFLNKFSYLFTQKIVGLLRTISRILKIGIYR